MDSTTYECVIENTIYHHIIMIIFLIIFERLHIEI